MKNINIKTIITMKKQLFLIAALFAVFTANAEKQLIVECGNAAQITATPAVGYHFVKWNDGITDNPRIISPTTDETYTAFFEINEYTISFQNWDGTDLQTNVYKHGDVVTYNGEVPTRPSTAQYDYTFSGWSPNMSYTATGEVTYTAQLMKQSANILSPSAIGTVAYWSRNNGNMAQCQRMVE